jgi:biopolymer transport protein ExbB/TolQ
MTEAFVSGGIIMYPLLVIGIGVLWLVARTTWLLARGENAADVERPLQGILFWGAFSMVLGFLGTTVGIIQIAQAITLAGRAEAPLIWGGFGVALITLIFGMLIFLFAAVCWFALRQWSWHRFARVRPAAPAV